MANDVIDHVNKLKAAREQVVAARRQTADALAKEHTRGHTEKMRELFINLQGTIDAIDQAILDERGRVAKDAIVP